MPQKPTATRVDSTSVVFSEAHFAVARQRGRTHQGDIQRKTKDSGEGTHRGGLRRSGRTKNVA